MLGLVVPRSSAGKGESIADLLLELRRLSIRRGVSRRRASLSPAFPDAAHVVLRGISSGSPPYPRCFETSNGAFRTQPGISRTSWRLSLSPPRWPRARAADMAFAGSPCGRQVRADGTMHGREHQNPLMPYLPSSPRFARCLCLRHIVPLPQPVEFPRTSRHQHGQVVVAGEQVILDRGGRFERPLWLYSF